MVALLSILFAPIAIVINGWYLSTLWRWLIVPLFNVRELPIVACIAVAIMVSAVHPTVSPIAALIKDKSPGETAVIEFTYHAMRIGLGLLVAFILKQFI